MLTSLSIDARNRLDTAWWAVYTRHQHEKVVAEMLSAKGFDVFLPLYESTRRWKDRSKGAFFALIPLLSFRSRRHRSQTAGRDNSRSPHDSLPR